jgi:hypothetical protein
MADAVAGNKARVLAAAEAAWRRRIAKMFQGVGGGEEE